MSYGPELSAKKKILNDIEGREELLNTTLSEFKPRFEKEFYQHFGNKISIRTQKALDEESFLNTESIEKLDKNGPDHGYTEKEVNDFKEIVKKYRVHDLRGTQLNIEETNIVRALEYKEHYEDLVNEKANFLKQKIENIKSAASVVIELENKREPLLDKIETIQSQIAEIELEVSDFEVTMTQEQRENLANLNAEKEKLQKEYDNFFEANSLKDKYLDAKENLSKAQRVFDNNFAPFSKMTDESKTAGKTNKYFIDHFDEYNKNCQLLDDFIDLAVESWNNREAKEKQNAIAAEEAKKQQEAAAKEAKEAEKAEAAKRAQKAVDDALEEARKKEEAQPFYIDKKMREYQKQFKDSKTFDGDIEKLVETSRNLLDDDDKKIFNDYINALNKNIQAKTNKNTLDFDNEFMDRAETSLEGGKALFGYSRENSRSKLDAFKKYKNLEFILNDKQLFTNGSKEEFLKSIGTLQAAHQYFNALKKPRSYNGPEKDNYAIAYDGLKTNLRKLDDKFSASVKDSNVAENLLYQLNDKVACKKGIRPDMLQALTKDAIDLHNPGRKTFFEAERSADSNLHEKEFTNTKLNAYFEAYNNLHGANKDKFMQKLQYATSKLNKESASIDKQLSDNKKEQRVIEGKNKLDTFTRESEKFNKKNWFARLFDRRGKAELARQKNELANEYGYSNVQLEIAKYGSKLDAKKLTGIINKAEKNKENAQLFAETIESFGLNDKKLNNAYNAFAKDFQEKDEPVKGEAVQENRKQIILEEIKDSPQQSIQKDLENDKSLELEKNLEETKKI